MTRIKVLLALSGIVNVGLLISCTTTGPADRKAPLTMCESGQARQFLGASYPEELMGWSIAFDTRNRPYILSDDAINTLRDGQWVRLSFGDFLRKVYPDLRLPDGGSAGRSGNSFWGMLSIDDSDGLYAVVTMGAGASRKNVLLYSPDLGRTFQAYELPRSSPKASRGDVMLEVRVCERNLSGPPAIGLLEFRKEHPSEWADYHNLWITVPVKKGDGLEIPEPTLVTSNCTGVARHSGGSSFAVTLGDRTYLTYLEIPRDGERGNPTYVAVYDHSSRKIFARKYLVTAPPLNRPDVHSTPVICADGKGYLHVISGAHNQAFQYLRSKAPERIDAGWSQPENMSHGSQSYATLICDGNDMLHSVFRQYRDVGAVLSCQTASALGGGPWSPVVPLVYPPKQSTGYGVFYHRVALDRMGGLYVSFTFNAQQGGKYPRALLLSRNGGHTWGLATADTFRQGIHDVQHVETLHGNGLDRNVVIRTVQREGATICHVFNPSPYTIETTLKFSSGEPLQEIANKESIPVTDGKAVLRVSPYSYRTFVLDRELLSAETVIPEEVKASAKSKIEMLDYAKSIPEDRLKDLLVGWSIPHTYGELMEQLKRMHAAYDDGDFIEALDIVEYGGLTHLLSYLAMYHKLDVLPEPHSEYRVICGSPTAYEDSQGRRWLPDQPYVYGMKAYGFSGMAKDRVDRGDIEIRGTDDPEIYRTERFNLRDYRFLVPNGRYSVRIHFAETWGKEPGKRVLDVYLENKKVLEGLDVFAEVGRNCALVKSFDGIEVADKELKVEIKPVKGAPMVNGIEVMASESGNK